MALTRLPDMVQQLNLLGLNIGAERRGRFANTAFQRRESEKDRQLQILLQKMQKKAAKKARKKQALITVAAVLGGAILAPVALAAPTASTTAASLTATGGIGGLPAGFFGGIEAAGAAASAGTTVSGALLGGLGRFGAGAIKGIGSLFNRQQTVQPNFDRPNQPVFNNFQGSMQPIPVQQDQSFINTSGLGPEPVDFRNVPMESPGRLPPDINEELRRMLQELLGGR